MGKQSRGKGMEANRPRNYVWAPGHSTIKQNPTYLQQKGWDADTKVLVKVRNFKDPITLTAYARSPEYSKANNWLIETLRWISHCVINLFAGLPQRYYSLHFKLEEGGMRFPIMLCTNSVIWAWRHHKYFNQSKQPKIIKEHNSSAQKITQFFKKRQMHIEM